MLILSLGTFLGGALLPSLRAELTDAEKKALFLKTHSGTSGAKKKSSASSTKSAKGSAKHSSSSSHGGSSSGTKKKSTSPRSSRSKKSSPSSSHSQSAGTAHSTASSSSPSPGRAVSHAAAAAPPATAAASTGAASHSSLSLPLPHGATPSAPITIEKSGVEMAEGLEPAATPAPAPAPAGGGLWSRLFGSRRSYSYLGTSTRAAIDRAPVRRGRWKYIVVHNSGTREGNARIFEIYHLRVRHMQNGLAYHFVIGDGHGSGDGKIEIGNRWTKQINGGHVASDYLNDIALGICLVGDFNRDTPTKAQMGALEELVSYLRDRVGKTQGKKAIVHAHKEINPRPTDCPGNRFPYSWLHAKCGNAR
ncbi:MAG: peptidoglycan recognition protein family protein [Verrucomicrobia bacterium]|nr:peptidoglycan recognition protein family protein [Verrucomicrobiota bacterium]